MSNNQNQWNMGVPSDGLLRGNSNPTPAPEPSTFQFLVGQGMGQPVQPNPVFGAASAAPGQGADYFMNLMKNATTQQGRDAAKNWLIRHGNLAADKTDTTTPVKTKKPMRYAPGTTTPTTPTPTTPPVKPEQLKSKFVDTFQSDLDKMNAYFQDLAARATSKDTAAAAREAAIAAAAGGVFAPGVTTAEASGRQQALSDQTKIAGEQIQAIAPLREKQQQSAKDTLTNFAAAGYKYEDIPTETKQALLDTGAFGQTEDQLKAAFYAAQASKQSLVAGGTTGQYRFNPTTQKYEQVIAGKPISTGGIAGYDITSYATDPNHENAVASIYSGLQNVASDPVSLDSYIKRIAPNSPVSGQMIINAANRYGVDPGMVAALIQQDSSFGTAGKAVRTLNPGNVGNDDAGNTRTYPDWQSGTDAVAEWLSRHRAQTSTLDQSRQALITSRYLSMRNNILKPYFQNNKNPIQLYTASAQTINRIDQALADATDPSNPNKGAADLDLVDAYVSIARGGQQISEAQVDTLLRSLGIAAKFDVASQKITGTAILDDGTRKELASLSKKIFSGQEKMAKKTMDTANKQLQAAGIPKQFQFSDPSEMVSVDTADGQDYSAYATQLQPGEVLVKDNLTGQVGAITEAEYDPSSYTLIQ